MTGPDEDYDDDPDPGCCDDEDADLFDDGYEQAEAYQAYAEHCETAHAGADCDCRSSLPVRLAFRARTLAWHVKCRIRFWLARHREQPPF